MNRLIRVFLLLVIAFIASINSFGMSINHGGRYVSIDSLSQNDTLCFINLNLKQKTLSFNIENQYLTFAQTVELDTTYQAFKTQNLSHEFETGKILLTIGELLSVESDSIYISASYREFNSKGVDVGTIVKIDRLAVSKTELSGVIISLSKKEIEKATKRYSRFMIALTAASAILVIAFGGQ